jgi:hypothetical protein
MKNYIETLNPGDPRETVELKRQQFAEVFIQFGGDWFKGQKIQEEGNRVTVRFNKSENPKGFVVKTVFREKFERWQKEAPKS